MNIWRSFDLASKAATAKKDRRSFLIGAIAIRNDGTYVTSSNGPAVICDCGHRHYFRSAHAEFRICRKIDKGATVFVVRIGIKDKDYKNAKPCKTCEKALRSRKVKKVYYTIDQNTYGCITFKY